MVRRCPKCNGRHYDLKMECGITRTYKDGRLTAVWYDVVTYRIATCKICGHDWDIDDQDEAKQLVEGCQSDKSKMS